MNVLVVEDDAPFARLMGAMLAQDRSPHATVHATSLQGALTHLESEQFDAVFVDLGLPDSKGLDTFRIVRERAGALPVIVVSGTDDEAAAFEAVHLGAADYLVKGGLTYRAVLRVLRHAIERHRLLMERDRLIDELRSALAEIKTLRGIVPICASCKRVRDDAGQWQQVEVYVRARSHAEFSHGLCPPCAEQMLASADLPPAGDPS